LPIARDFRPLELNQLTQLGVSQLKVCVSR
jgi:hypothetical protein